MPTFNFPERAARRARSGETYTVQLRLQVNRQGSIDSVSIASSSGNAAIDQAAIRQAKQGRFHPFKQNDVAVVGMVTLPITYVAPR